MQEYQKELDQWFKKNDWRYWSPLAILARLVEECGEFARLVNHLYGEKPKKDGEKKQNLAEELGDIIYTLICFTNSQGINLDSAIKRSLKKSMARDKNRFTPKPGGHFSFGWQSLYYLPLPFTWLFSITIIRMNCLGKARTRRFTRKIKKFGLLLFYRILFLKPVFFTETTD